MSEGGKIGRDLENLPVGFRFAPTDEELIDNYLKPKILGMDSEVENIPEVDICKWDPWELPGSSVMKADDPECSSVFLITSIQKAVVPTGQQRLATGNPPVRIVTSCLGPTKR